MSDSTALCAEILALPSSDYSRDSKGSSLADGRDSYKLGALVDAFGLAEGLPHDLVPHRATYEAIVCARLLAHLATPPDRAPLTLTELLNIMAGKATTDSAADEPAATLF
ncbi:hypothetical protein EV643_12017 [Kribbella sp. VKM Ac-2527]|uniref:Uncharacterized protein n=1 Tax=Kribbella caucasensis TaxID=2512215 RepID=A0A4R6JKL2_9ACTN|nr:hypothetical protein [Kribbella sp. VKM Ac-2527]TDO36287.1 hypothetical protein EV643_12017 [Kribbella sp. VKM Ac-2527]